MVLLTHCHGGLSRALWIFTGIPDLYSLRRQQPPPPSQVPASQTFLWRVSKHPLGQGQNHPLSRTLASCSLLQSIDFFLIQGKVSILIEQRKVVIKPKNDMNCNLGNVHYVPSPTLNTWCVVGNSVLTRVTFLGRCWHDSVPCFNLTPPSSPSKCVCLLKRTPVAGFTPTRIQYDLILTSLYLGKDPTSRYSLRLQVDLNSTEMLFKQAQAHSASPRCREVTRPLKVHMSKCRAKDSDHSLSL